ncbi:LapA family protein, partial [Francisella tularensis subsp. holarctica]|nr:LapA family protein [Francisella tularensis subsp. holarctica]
LIVLLSISFVLGLLFGSIITKFIKITKTSGGAKN